MASTELSAAATAPATPGASTPADPPPREEPAGTGGPGYKPFPLPKRPKPPPSVAAMIQEGKKTRVMKSQSKKVEKQQPPAPSVPRGTMPTDRDVHMSRRAWRAKARCLRRHNAVLSDRMEQLSKPTRRQLICMWRNYAPLLTPEQIYNLQNMLDASNPFKPEQAYDFFINLKKNQKKNAELAAGRAAQAKNLKTLCGDRQFAWAKNATIAIARGLQDRLSRPGSYQLKGGLLRLSDIVLFEMCKCRPTPSRQCAHPKTKFLIEMADKIAVWIDEILTEADERMLMMDFDEDEAVEALEVKREASLSPGEDSSKSKTTVKSEAATPAGTVPPSAKSSGPSTPAASTPGTATSAASTPGANTPETKSPGDSTPGASAPGASTPGATTPEASKPK